MKHGITRLIVLLFVVFASVSALAQQQGNGNYRGSWDHPHMWDGWGWMFLGPLIMIVCIAAIVGIVILVVRWLGAAGQITAPHSPPGGTSLNILNERFARGELDKDEFEERKRLLSE